MIFFFSINTNFIFEINQKLKKKNKKIREKKKPERKSFVDHVFC